MQRLLAGCTAQLGIIHTIKNELGVNEAHILCLSFSPHKNSTTAKLFKRKCDKGRLEATCEALWLPVVALT